MLMKRILILFIAVCVGSDLFATGRMHWGVAKRVTGELAYFEQHTIERNKEALISTTTEYLEPKKQVVIAKMTSDYTRSLKMPTYEFQDLRTGYKEGLRFSKGSYYAFFQHSNQKEKFAKVKPRSSLFSSQGWHYYLVENLEKLDEKGFELNLVLPGELDDFRFKLHKVRSKGKRLVAKLELASWFLKIFAPNFLLTYDKAKRSLIEYRGISNIKDENGDNHDVVITYVDKKPF